MITSFPNSFSSIAGIDNEIAAFCGGFTDDYGNIYICRVAINPKYAWYGPGNLLISSTIEILSDQPDGDEKWKYFDLTRGEEPYKLKFGGELHYNSLFKIGAE